VRRLYAIALVLALGACDRVIGLSPNQPPKPDAVDLDGAIQPAGVVLERSTVARGSFTTSITSEHTVGNFTGRLLLVAVSLSFSGTHVTGITYANTPLTLVGTKDAPASDGRVELWSLADPPPGTADLAITLTDSASNVLAGVTSFTGAGSLGPVASAANTIGGPTISLAATPDALVIGFVMWNGGDYSTLTADANHDSLWNENAGRIVGAGGTTRGAATTTLSWSVVGNFNDYWATMGVAIKPAP
jgi:hypothetical protein